MPGRRLTERQQQRIRRIQERRRAHLEARIEHSLEQLKDTAAPRSGRVVASYGAHLAIRDGHGRLYHCLFRQNLGQAVCGDRVVWQPTGDDQGVVTAVLERGSVLSRPDYSGRDKPLAANLTQLVVVLAPRPEPNEYLLDQYLVSAELIGVRALVTINKADLVEGAAHGAFVERFTAYRAIGYPVIAVSAKRPDGLRPLLPYLRHQTSILVGQSGVGKSSLIKALLPDQEIQVGRLSEATGLGRHTTSVTSLYTLPGGGELVDSPGVRSFRLVPLDRQELAQGFRELRPLLGHCQFADCRHEHEPGCALKQAAEQGAVDPGRLQHYRHLARKLEELSRSG